jgi:hypothetical protein
VAPVPPPQQEKNEEGNEKVEPEIPNLPRPDVEVPVNNWNQHLNVPAGAVPPPQGYVYHKSAQVRKLDRSNYNDYPPVSDAIMNQFLY